MSKNTFLATGYTKITITKKNKNNRISRTTTTEKNDKAHNAYKAINGFISTLPPPQKNKTVP